eukprot:gb/GFBE01080323.1/.p1 GENE.gb/GFBE01080323.1/~~gb/GFBE01080323.1/.p1  ORF type:complete len:934 (+),score=199.60 gb/GFBE01080323.1/:1-2802(+)
MSSDKKLLEALSKRCGARIVYFDLVAVHFPEHLQLEAALENGPPKATAGPKFAPPKRAYLCVGRSALFLVSYSLSRVLPQGQVEYAWIEKVVEDTSSRNRFMVVLNYDAPKDSPAQLMVDTWCREGLLSRIFDNYLADSLLRIGKLVALPKFEQDLMALSTPSSIRPFKGFKVARFMDFTFHIREEFQELPNAVSKVLTGVYGAPLGVLHKAGESRSWSSWMGGSKNTGPQLELLLNVLDPVPLSHLARLGQEHVRWVANQCKQALCRNWNTLVLRNQPCLKKMNLSNDIASWICWELLLQDNDSTWALVLLRRQYVPPMLDTVQDFVLSIKCPTNCVIDGTVKEQDLMHEVSMIADSFSSQLHPNIFVDIIQAKLDALLYDEDAYEWIFNRLGLRPNGKAQLEKYSTIFVKGVAKLLSDEHVLTSSQPMEEAEKLTNAICDNLAERDLEPMQVALKLLSNPGEGLQRNAAAGSYAAACVNAWNFRVASYLAFRLDGSMLGSRLTLADLIAGVHHGAVAEETSKVFVEILSFLLHLRRKDLRVPWEPKALTSHLTSMGLLSSMGPSSKAPLPGGDDGEQSATGVQCMFNDRVMQALIETGHLRAVLRDERSGGGCMSTEFTYLLSNLLQCDAASVNLKASICRLIITDKAIGDSGQAEVLCGGLTSLMETGSLFLATMACAALVNLSQSREAVRGHLIIMGVVDSLDRNLRSKDNDLMLYTLMLLVHLTKRSNHRAALMQRGLLNLLYEVFSSTYQQLEHRRRVLSELCSVLGQLCNDEHSRATLSEPKWQVADKLLSVMEAALKWPAGRLPGQTLPERSVKILSKVFYALKQLSAGSLELKEQIARAALPAVVQDLSNLENLKNSDWASNAVLLLHFLTSSRKATKLIQESGWTAAYGALMQAQLSSTEVIRARITHIAKCVVSHQLPTETH